MCTFEFEAGRGKHLAGIDLINKWVNLCKLKGVCLQPQASGGVVSNYCYKEAAFCSFVADFSWYGRFVVPSGHYLACYFHDGIAGDWCMGSPLAARTLLVAIPGSVCDMKLNARSRVSMFLAPENNKISWLVNRHADSFASMNNSCALFHYDKHANTPLNSAFDMLFHNLVGASDVSAFDQLEREAMAFLLDEPGLTTMLAGTSIASRYPFTRLPDYPTLRRAIQFMDTNFRRDIYIKDIALSIPMSERNLCTVFDKLLQVSPSRYLSSLRLHEAAFSLCTSLDRISVKAAALGNGIWHLSRFSAHYYNTFGEYPSDTLNRAARYA